MEARETNHTFVYRSYPKGELAQLYLPGYARATAVKKFNAWLKHSEQLSHQLNHSGAGLHTRIYTTAQVRRIVEHLGEP